MSKITVACALALALCTSFFFLPAARAATYIVPTDAELVDDAGAIVSGTILSASARYNDRGAIETVLTMAVDEVLKGDLPPRISLVQWGGRIGDRWMVVADGPTYQVGKRYLVFMVKDRRENWTTQHLALGQFTFTGSGDGELLSHEGFEIRGWERNGSTFRDRKRTAEEFLQFIRERVRGRQAVASYFVEPPLTGNADPSVAPNFVGYDFVDASTVGVSAWTDDPGSSVGYGIGSDASGNALNLDDSEERIIEEDPNGEIAGAFTGSGVVATAFSAGGGFHTFGTPLKSYISITHSDIVTQNGLKASGSLTQATFRTTMTHEVGHTLGFRHSNQASDNINACSTPLPCTSSAVMNSSVSGTFNGALQSWDVDAVQATYGGGGEDGSLYTTSFCADQSCSTRTVETGRRQPFEASTSFRLAKLEVVCTAPSIVTHPLTKTVSLGSSSSLTVSAAGTVPLTYAWFIGSSGDTSVPTGTNASTLILDTSAVGVTNYWVRVSNSCPGSPVNSNTATVTVSCTNPAINSQPVGATINQGQSKQLGVGATGSNLTFQWFVGNSGDTSTPIAGGTSSTVTVTPATTTSYWVRVSGACGTPVDSATATVTVVPCAALTVDAPVSTQLPGTGNFSITVNGNSTSTPITYNWFRGGTPGFGGTSLGPGQTKTVNVTAPTVFWARVQNGCGRVEFSTGLTLAPCTLPGISAQPQDQTVNFNSNAALTIGVTGTGVTVKWFRGTVGDKSNQVATGTSVSVGPLTATTQFWAEVSNSCGPVSSRQVTVTVNQLTELVAMLGNRFFVQVAYRNQFDNGKEGKLLGRSLFSTSLSETAIFTFGDPLVVELMVRVSDARPFDNHIHVFLGGLSDVEFNVVVTDSLTGIVKEYKKPANQLIGTIDRSTFPASNSLQDGVDALMAQTAARHITPSAEVSTINLLNNRFQVRMRYRNQFTNPAGEGYMNARSIAKSTTTETAVFFFDENVGSVEWMVRFSDARPFVERIDLFHGGLSDVEFTIEVLDTKTGAFKEYPKGPFSLLGQVDRDTYLP